MTSGSGLHILRVSPLILCGKNLQSGKKQSNNFFPRPKREKVAFFLCCDRHGTRTLSVYRCWLLLKDECIFSFVKRGTFFDLWHGCNNSNICVFLGSPSQKLRYRPLLVIKPPKYRSNAASLLVEGFYHRHHGSWGYELVTRCHFLCSGGRIVFNPLFGECFGSSLSLFKHFAVVRFYPLHFFVVLLKGGSNISPFDRQLVLRNSWCTMQRPACS